MSESPQPAPSEAERRASQLASLQKYKAEAGVTTPEEPTKPHLELVKSESVSTLPQRVRPAEVQAPAESQEVEETLAPVEAVAPTPSEEQTQEARPAFQLVNETNAKEQLDKLRASQDLQAPVPVENETPEYVGKRIDTTVKLDGPSRAPEFAGEHREGQHVSEVELTSDSEVQTGGEHAVSQHVSEVELTPDSETQTGGKHLPETELSTEAVASVEAPVVPTPEKRRSLGSIVRRLFRK